MEMELYNLIEDGATADEIGEWMFENCRREFNGKFFIVNGDRLYPVIEDGSIAGWEWD